MTLPIRRCRQAGLFRRVRTKQSLQLALQGAARLHFASLIEQEAIALGGDGLPEMRGDVGALQSLVRALFEHKHRGGQLGTAMVPQVRHSEVGADEMLAGKCDQRRCLGDQTRKLRFQAGRRLRVERMRVYRALAVPLLQEAPHVCCDALLPMAVVAQHHLRHIN